MTDLDSHYEGAGKYWGVDPFVLRAIHAVEDPTEDPRVRSKAGAIGHMQIMPETARSLGIDPEDPMQSIYGAARVLRENLDRYGNLPDALRAYNAGTDRGRWNNNETNAYVSRVAAAYHKPEEPAVAKKTTVSNPDDAAFDKAWGLGGIAKASSAPSATSPSNDTEIDRMWGLTGDGQKKPVATARVPQRFVYTEKGEAPRAVDANYDPTNDPAIIYPERKSEQQNWGNNALNGFTRGGADVLESGLHGVNWLLGKAGLRSDATQQGEKLIRDDRQSYDYNYGGSLAAGVGRLGGNIAMTAPVGGAALSLGGRAAASGARAAGLGTAAQKASGFVLGNAGAGAVANLALTSKTGQDAGHAIRDGALLGVAAGGVGAAVGKGVKGLVDSVRGGTISEARANLAQMAREKYGIDLTAPQISTNQGMKYLASGAAGGTTTPEQLAQFTRAVSRTFGQDSHSLSPDVIEGAHNALGSRFDHVAANTVIRADNQFGSELGQIAEEAKQVLPEAEVAPIANQIENIFGKIQHGEISGPQYQALTRFGAPLARAMRSNNPNISYYAGRVRDVFDDAMERSLEADGKHDLLEELRDARLQYKNLKTVEPLVAKASEDGVISPSLLNGAVNKSFSSRARSGAGDLGELAQIGQAFMKNQPNSGTPGRLEALGALGALPAAAFTGSWEAPASMLGIAAMRGMTRGVMDSNMLADSLIERGLSQDIPVNKLTKGLLRTAQATPHAAIVPAATAFHRNALNGK